MVDSILWIHAMAYALIVIDVLFIASIFGVIGSLAARTIRAGESGFDEAQYWNSFPRFISGFAGESLVGAAAGLAGLLLIVAIGGVESLTDDWSSADEILRIIAISVIFGFGARRLFPMLVEDIAEKLKKNERAIAELDRESEIDDENIRMDGAVRRVIDGNENDITTRYTLRKAVEFIDSGNAHPFLYVNTARLYRHAGRLDDAISLLKDLLARRGQLRDSKYDNFNAALYNLACYYSLKGEPETAKQFFERYMKDSTDKKAAASEARIDPDLEDFFSRFPNAGKI